MLWRSSSSGIERVSRPSMSTRPELGSTRRLIMRRRVDLPAPDVPTTTAIVPSSTRKDTSSTTTVFAVALGEMLDLDHLGPSPGQIE
jgi:hypothetical protein